MAGFLQTASSSSSAYVETAVQRQLRKNAGESGLFGMGDGNVAIIFVLSCGLFVACIVLCRPKYFRSLGRYIRDEVLDPSAVKYWFMTSWTPRMRQTRVSRPKIESPAPVLLSEIEPPRLSQIRLAALAARRAMAPVKPINTTQARVASTAVSDAFGVYHREGQVTQKPVVTSDKTRRACIDHASLETLPRLLGQERSSAGSRPKSSKKGRSSSHKKGGSYKTTVGVNDAPSSKLVHVLS
eukprot:gnl/MRDRNA2_/MRDRNA2_55258_c0_seq1.p1 gnl/MRDRNA2_/MRDRNA2_55258_c0~~gnl/MRDRNA2_/MRDRNA2_55258_c0_seq1.p1  ORF type:complete len:240 (+),score=25.00 gnl/MRDRNA2_/MRDRNA2_55258_c0_seq1:91-810(+)